MDRNFYDNDEFDEFLKQKADQYKMYPSDRVWSNIYRSLHGRTRKIIIGLTVVFVASSVIIGKEAQVNNHLLSNAPRANTLGSKSSDTKPGQTAKAGNMNANAQPSPLTVASINSPTAANTTNNNIAFHHNNNNVVEKIAARNTLFTTADPNATIGATASTPIVNHSTIEQAMVIENNPLPATLKKDDDLILSNKIKLPTAGKTLEIKTPAVTQPVEPARLSSARELALSELKPSPWTVQFYASPIVSYRRLTDNQPGSTPPVSSNYAGNINRYVHHQPAPGFEAGAKLLYKLSDNLSIYAGAQINYSRYFIDAYKYSVEKASIALKEGAGQDTVSGYTNIRNFSGFAPEQLQNQYWQFSVPVGIEIKLLGHKKLQFNVAGGVQPTFLISSDSYLISSDYKNYIQSPDLARTFNVHTNFEAFLSYQSNGYKFQLGPQFRSQLLSSYSNQYRVREYLTEFGIKLGITKTLRW